MKKVNLYFREDQIAQIKALEKKTGARFAAIVRLAVDAYFKKGK